jgi:hypothetical protein
VEVDLGAPGPGPSPGWIAGPLTLPGGSVAGSVSVRQRDLAGQWAHLKRQGLLAAGIAALALIVFGMVFLGRLLLGPRLRRASALNLTVFLAVLVGSRLGISMLRDYLGLGAGEAFTSFDFATQVPTGILRSPADLALTAGFALLAVVLFAVAGYRSGSGGGDARPAGLGAASRIVLSGVLGVVAVGVVLASEPILQGMLADCGVAVFTISPFDASLSHTLLRVGVMFVASCLVLG